MSKRELWVVEWKSKKAKTWNPSIYMVRSSFTEADAIIDEMTKRFPHMKYQAVMYAPKGEK
jgi:hypothetical protein